MTAKGHTMDLPNEPDERDCYAVTESMLHTYLREIDQIPLRGIQQTEAEPSSAELGAALGLPPAEVEDLLRVYRQYVSLDMPVGGDGEVSALDLMPSITVPPAEEMLSKAAVTREIEDLLGQLPPVSSTSCACGLGSIMNPKRWRRSVSCSDSPARACARSRSKRRSTCV
jgi:hypothetical protein